MERLKELVEKLKDQVVSNSSSNEMLETIFEFTRVLYQQGQNTGKEAILEKENKKVVFLSDGEMDKNPFSLNEKLKSDSKDILEKLKTSPVDSLKDAIGLNERFVFAHVFFNDEMGNFEKLISLIENASTFEDAQKIINRDIPQDLLANNLDIKDQFFLLVKRKFDSR